MSTFLIFVIIIVIIVIFNFAKDSYNENDKLVKQGGMRVKYRTLIDNFIDPDSGLDVVKETNNYVCVGTQNAAGSIAFHFQHSFNKITVTFEMKNLFIGNHKLDWTFPETMDQQQMIDRIESGTRQYMDNVSSTFK